MELNLNSVTSLVEFEGADFFLFFEFYSKAMVQYFFSYFRIFLLRYQIFISFFVNNFSYFIIKFYYRAIK